jgi:hypothetical protein
MTDINELFARDPLSFTKEGGEIRAIVEKLRESRGQYRLGAQKAGNMKPPKTATGKAVASLSNSGLSLNLQALLAPKEKK